MVYVPKSVPSKEITEALNREKRKTNGNYKLPEILEKLKTDFKDKCYLCETKNLRPNNIEHFIPCGCNKDLVFSYDNLFWACSDCNNTKLDRYNTQSDNEILNCTKEDDNVETVIEYSVDIVPEGNVTFKLKNENVKTKNTATLLSEIYNGTTLQKRMGAVNLRNALIMTVYKFHGLLLDYYNAITDELKQYYKIKIGDELSTASEFAAFKRWIIRRNPKLLNEFGEYFQK